MKKKRIVKSALIISLSGIFVTIGIVLYLFNMPHRNIQDTKTDFSTTVTDIVSEYLNNEEKANQKYLAIDGNSKILEITGKVKAITIDFKNQKVILLKEEGVKAGVSATFTTETTPKAAKLEIGQTVTIKGVIRSGAGYDSDLELYENIILEKCDVITK